MGSKNESEATGSQDENEALESQEDGEKEIEEEEEEEQEEEEMCVIRLEEGRKKRTNERRKTETKEEQNKQGQFIQEEAQGSKLLGFRMSGTPKNGDRNPIPGPGFPTRNP